MPSTDFVFVDGRWGEGGGQILRSALSLSVLTARAVEVSHIRARRPKPGLRPQHLTVVRALAKISGAEVEGDFLGSQHLRFSPGEPRPGEYRFEISTAGSVVLLAQALLPVALFFPGRWRFFLRGGTHVPMAPTYDYFSEVFLEALRRLLGAEVRSEILRAGFYPKGGGEILVECGEIQEFRRAPPPSRVVLLIQSGGRRFSTEVLRKVRERGWEPVLRDLPGTPGLAFLVRKGFHGIQGLGEEVLQAMGFSPLGMVDSHLADQLLLYAFLRPPSALSFPMMTSHFRTHLLLLQRFLRRRVSISAGPPVSLLVQ